MAKHYPSNFELLEAIGDAMGSISDAMESLRGYEEFDNWRKFLGDILDEMQPKQAEYQAIDDYEWQQEMADMERQYYKSVL